MAEMGVKRVPATKFEDVAQLFSCFDSTRLGGTGPDPIS